MAAISILVPVYNVEKYLKPCLESILLQTFTDFEVICMDDGSTDKSGKILDEYALRDERIRVVHKKNSGYGSTMNMAMQLADGKYIGIVESDDTIEEDMYQVLYDAVTTYDLDMVKSDFYFVWHNEDGTVRKKYFELTDDKGMYNRIVDPDSELESYLLHKFTWNALYKKELISKNRIRYNETPGAAYQDNGFWFQTFYWSKRAMFLDRAFYNYRQDNMAASSHNKRQVYAMKNEFDRIREFMLAHNDKRDMLYKICFHLRMLAYFFTLNRISPSLKVEFAKEIKDECAFFEKQGEACYDYMTEEQISILRNPETYVENVLIQCKEITEEVVADYSTIIVYGAGSYGERIVYRVKAVKTDTQTMKVAVTNLNGKHMECMGEPVCEIGDCIRNKAESLVILAVKENSDTFNEMLNCLKKLKFPHIISASAKRMS